MKQHIYSLIVKSLQNLQAGNALPAALDFNPQIDNARDAAHGDFTSNIAMVLAKAAKQSPRELAHNIIRQLPKSPYIDKAEVAGPGFINFFLKASTHQAIVQQILQDEENYGRSKIGANKRILLEFVSANPTGPLHIGHGRGAAYGAAVASLLKQAGFDVSCEYYVNDAGRQMDILAVSVWLRYLQLGDPALPFPDNGYQGDYINAIAKDLMQAHADIFKRDVTAMLPLYEITDPEQRIDALIKYCIETLSKQNYETVFNAGLDSILKTIEKDLSDFGVTFDNWFSERSLVNSNAVERSLETLQENNWLYEKNGAKWFRSSDLGDEKDRVLIRENGQATYFASDIAYHKQKLARGFDTLIDIWGADHHGYIARVKAALQALDLSADKLEILLVQFATLYRGKEKLQMSTRSGEFITLKELQDEVGKDAARFYYIMRKSEQHLDFDLELAKSESNDNLVYYIQYAHARICSVFRQARDKNYSYTRARSFECLSELKAPHEISLLANLARFTDVIEKAACAYEPHQLAYYLKDLANDFHTYYNANQFLVENEKLRLARLALIEACRVVICKGLGLLGVSAPEEM